MKSWVLVATMLALAAAPAMGAEWQRYDNQRFGFAIALPAEGFNVLPQSTPDRLELADTSGETLLSVYGGPNPVAGGLDAFADYLIDSGAVGELTYRRAGRTWLVLSGYLDGPTAEKLIFYAKFMFSPDHSTLSAFEITYPRSAKARLDPVVERLEDTLTSPKAPN
jgi:hypothetical protein